MLGGLTESQKMLNEISELEATIIDNKLGIESEEYKQMHHLTEKFIDKTRPIFFPKKQELTSNRF